MRGCSTYSCLLQRNGAGFSYAATTWRMILALPRQRMLPTACFLMNDDLELSVVTGHYCMPEFRRVYDMYSNLMQYSTEMVCGTYSKGHRAFWS